MAPDLPRLTPELRQLAQGLLAIVEPLVEAGLAFASAADGGQPGKCQQLWCPVCAVVAAAAGEQHPLSTLLATHGDGYLAMLRMMSAPDDVESEAAPPADEPGRYQRIDVTILE